MKTYLEKIIADKKAKMEDLRAKSDSSESVEEVRSIGETLANLKNEIGDAEEQLKKLDEEEKPAENENPAEGDEPRDEGRSAKTPQGNFKPIATYGNQENRNGDIDMEDITNSIEYRTAFMNYVRTGKKSSILSEARGNEQTKTTDVGTVIPTVLIDKIIEKMESTGMILPLVTRTQYKAGVEIPTSSLKPVASWVAEGAGSDRQKLTTDKIVFTHHKLRCEVSITMEVGTMALSSFERKIVDNIVEAMVKAIEQSIISGDGSGKPKGILAETPESGQAITLTSGTALSYKLLCQAEAAIPQAYEANVKYCMTKKSFYAFIGMVDNDGQPIARVNYGIGGKPEYVLMGREVVLCGDYMNSYVKEPSANTTFAFLFNFSDYMLNTIYDMGVQKKQDWDTEDILTKAVTACDGKVCDKRSLVTLTINKA